jgi:hypothetical protein
MTRVHKTNVVGMRAARLQAPTAPRSARAILEGTQETLPGLADQLRRHEAWREWLAARLPAALAGKLSGVVESEGCLTLLAPSGPWCARLRYALPELTPMIRARTPSITRVKVRVLPKG